MEENVYRQKLDSWIEAHSEQMTEDIMKLIRIDSVRGEASEGKPYGEGPAMALKAMTELMEEYGLSVNNYENYCVTGDLDGEEEKYLDILAHLDVVPVSEDWTKTAPFEPLIEGDYLYGRGSSDDKGPAVAALYAMRAVRELGIPLRHGVRLICGSDEECGSSDLVYYYGREKEARYTFSPDADYPVINIEKARLAKEFTAQVSSAGKLPRLVSMTAGSKVNVIPGKAEAVFEGLDDEQLKKAVEEAEKKTGVEFSIAQEGQLVRLYAKGNTGHAAHPYGSKNALTAMLYLISLLPLGESDLTDRLHSIAGLFPFGDHLGEALGVKMSDEESGELTISLDILNYADGKLSASFDSRAPLCATNENLTEKIRRQLKAAGFDMEEGDMTPAHHVSADSFFVRSLLESYEQYTGKKGEAIAIGGGTYVHELERGVAFGCAETDVDNRMHGDDEFVKISIMIMSAKIFADSIIRLCGLTDKN